VARVRLPESEWTSAVGLADVESDEPMTEDLVWPIRSITKSFTVTVLLQLVDEGVLSLDDTLDEWVPDMPNAEEITLGQLADMTAGVPEYTNDAFIADFVEDQDATFTGEDLIGYAMTEDPSSEPGAAHLYINTSTVLLGEVIEQVTGQDFDEVVTERVLDPLGLSDTTYVTEPHGWTGPHATGYQPDDDELAPQDANFTVFGTAGAMTSTIDDLTEWGPALATGELLEPDTQAARLIGTPLDEGPEYDTYAYGIGELDGWWGHTGEGFGVTALVMHDADSDATVAIFMNLSNVGDHVPTKLFREFARILSS
jgi:D-alanyl-D-alanine carboxypeptidase